MPFLPRKTGELPCYGEEFYRVEDENKSQFLVYTKSSKTGPEHAILFSVQTWEPLRPAPEQCSTYLRTVNTYVIHTILTGNALEAKVCTVASYVVEILIYDVLFEPVLIQVGRSS